MPPSALESRIEDLELQKFIGRDVKRDHIETDLIHIAEHICGVPRKIADAILRHSGWEVVGEEVAEKYKSNLALYRAGKDTTPHAALQGIGTRVLKEVFDYLDRSAVSKASPNYSSKTDGANGGGTQMPPQRTALVEVGNTLEPLVAHSQDSTSEPKKHPTKPLRDAADAEEDSKEAKRTRTKACHSSRGVSSDSLECLACGSYYYVLNLVIEDGLDISLNYYDRTISLQVDKTEIFRSAGHTLKPSGTLALIVYATNYLECLRSGLDPSHPRPWSLKPFTFSRVPGVLDRKFGFTLLGTHRCRYLAKTGNQAHLRIRLPIGSTTNTIFKNDGLWTVENLVGKYLDLQPEDRSSQGNLEARDLESFKITDITHKPRQLAGRATLVLRLQKAFPGTANLGLTQLILKLGWPSKRLPSEIAIINRLASKLPKGLHDHIPKIYFAATFTAKQLSLPWTKFLYGPTLKHEPELRSFLVPSYSSLWELDSVEEFKEVWLDCVECHFQAWNQANILHRDLSQSNLMFQRTEHGHAVGVLNDWDLASRTDELGLVPFYDSIRRRGTHIFMAMDFLIPAKRPVEHFYRHDLESFFYILIWAAIHYNFETKVPDPVHPSVKSWMEDSEKNAFAKLDILRDDDYAEEIFSHVKPEFSGVLEDWIRPLRGLFWDGVMSEHDRAQEEDYYLPSYGGLLTFETFMQAIKVTPRTWGQKGQGKVRA